MVWHQLLFVAALGFFLLTGAVNTARRVRRQWRRQGGSESGGWVRGTAVVALNVIGWFSLSGAFIWGFEQAGWLGGLSLAAMGSGILMLILAGLAWPPARRVIDSALPGAAPGLSSPLLGEAGD
ncbi:MAG: hypothetical protein ACPGNT_02785 [Rhodospirillales bacterium]